MAQVGDGQKRAVRTVILATSLGTMSAPDVVGLLPMIRASVQPKTKSVEIATSVATSELCADQL